MSYFYSGISFVDISVKFENNKDNKKINHGVKQQAHKDKNRD